MANRNYNELRAIHKEMVVLAGRFLTTTGGTLSTTSFTPRKQAGFTLAKTGSEVGRYTITLDDAYMDLLGCSAIVEGAADAAFTTANGVTAFLRNVAVSTTKTLDVQFARQDTGADAEVIDGATIRIVLFLKNSSV